MSSTDELVSYDQSVVTAPSMDSRFKQQRVAACRPFLTPLSACFVYIGFFVISLIFGLTYIVNSAPFEQVLDYTNCSSLVCTKTLSVEEDVTGPFYIYYQLTNFYQNNFMYSDSKNWDQLQGKEYDSKKLKSCSPMISINDSFPETAYVPCGTVPMSIFNDTFTLDIFENGTLSESDISFNEFRDLFKSPNKVYNESIMWMDETIFPGNQTNEHFVNWMQLAPFSKFRKLWGVFDEKATLKKGNHTITINNNYPVESFGGTKSLIISKTNWYGGKNNFFGIFFIVISLLSFLAALTFGILNLTKALPLQKALSRADGVLELTLIA